MAGALRGVPVVRFGWNAFRLQFPKVTTGLPLYLVSACGTAEEFVAAFRRYADRTGLFIPAAAPLPAGRRGRIALTLKDGGVMIEGEAEILQSSVKPTVLHGRPGMTVKFVEPDDASKQVIAELEKARLAMKPAAPSVAPRPAEIPATPRPVPPVPSGRIDAANALAECVVIGDPATLRETAASPRAMPDGKFVVPTIPAVGAPRPKTPSTAPDPHALKPPAVERAKPATVPPDPAATKLPAPATMPKPPANSRMTSIGFPIVDKVPAKSEPVVSNATTLGMPALDRKPDPAHASTKIGTEAPLNPTPPFIPVQSPPASKPSSPHDEPAAEPTAAAKPLEPASEDEATTIGAPPVKKPADPPAAVPVASPADASAAKRAESAKHKATSIGFPALRTPFETQPLTLVPQGNPFKADGTYDPQPPTLPKSPRSAAAPTPRGKTPTTPPLTPRHPTPVAPVPIVRPPAKAAPHAPEEEATELSSELVATAPTEPMPSVDSGAVPKPAQRSGGMRASEILAAIPAGDWTMTPDESMPHALPAEAKLPAMPDQEPTPAPSPPPVPSGDWTISLDPQTGWSEPAKVAPAEVGNPVHAVASDKPINVVQWDEKPTGIGESKIEIDSSLMDTQRRAPSSDDEPARIIDTKPADIPPPLGRYTPPTTPPRYPVRPSSTDLVGYGAAQSAVPMAPAGNKKKMIALAIIAVSVAAGAIVMLVLTLGGSKQTSQAATGTPSAGSAAPAVAPAPPPIEPAPEAPPAETGSAQVAAAVPAGSASEAKPPEVEAAVPEVEAPKPATACKVDIRSVPAGADIYVDQQKLGTAPRTIELPCGTETKLTLKKKSFPTTPRLVTPVAGKANKLVVKLAKTLFSVKVTSTPAGATITSGKKSVGVTPTTIKLPAYEASSITLKKPGYAPDTQRVNPKRNNTSHHVTLKKGR
jgi:hypothetical protein